MLKDSWIFPIAESVHLAGIALMVGSIVLADLRTLGHSHKPIATSWVVAGLAMIAATAPILFLSNVPRYLSNPAFVVKMCVLLLAVAAHFTIHRRRTRVSAIVSMILWTAVVLGGRAIADFDV